MSAESDFETVHLLVLIHGMWGNPSHLSELRRIVREKYDRADAQRGPAGERLHLLLAETNRDDGTYDGIDWGGERVAEEVLQEVKALAKEGKKVTRFSITGYSLGGLISRYVVGILSQRGFFNEVTPVTFNTIATPHVGLPRYPTVISSMFNYLGPRLLSRTGEQFYVVDKWSQNGRPLLEVMADPKRVFYQALTLFQQVRIYANAVNDGTVPYVTAAIEEEDVFMDHSSNGMRIELDDQYSPLIKSYTFADTSTRPPKPRVFTPKWFKSLKPERPLLPPTLQFRFPFNILFFCVLPLLIPIILILVIIRLSLSARASRSRITVLEKDESSAQRLVNIVGRLEREMEGVVVDMFDSPRADPDPDSSPTSSLSHAPPPDIEASAVTKGDGSGGSAEAGGSRGGQQTKKGAPVLSETQRKIVAALNTLPGLKKELVFIHPVRNSHATIIARDVHRFPAHRQGEGVIRHWADHFII